MLIKKEFFKKIILGDSEQKEIFKNLLAIYRDRELFKTACSFGAIVFRIGSSNSIVSNKLIRGVEMKKTARLVALMAILLIATSCYAEIIPFDSDRWDISGDGAETVTYKGKASVFLPAGGMAVLEGADFLNGSIEYDVALPNKRGFMGAMWRMQDKQNFEKFYMRPHQSGNPDANQYTPVYNGVSGWQLYYGKDFSVPFTYTFDEWIHVKIVVSGENAEIYINDNKKPALGVTLKREIKSGAVGVEVGGSEAFKLAGAHFANFNYSPLEKTALTSTPTSKSAAEGTVMQWNVSNAFGEKGLKDAISLSSADMENLTWTLLQSEDTGVTNFAEIRNKSKKANTVFAKIVVHSEIDQVKRFDFGFSDRVKVFVNKRLLFSANDTYRTRDYRFLGTMGYYESLYLSLQKGDNEILLAVSESFGGWGVQAKFQDMDKIQLQ